MINILLFGANGFIGRNIKEYLQENRKDCMVTALTREECDLTDEVAVSKILNRKSFDIVINAAIFNFNSRRILENATEMEQDLRMFMNLEKYGNGGGYGRMLYFGSGAEFDKSCPIASVKESEFCNYIPKSQYGFSKYIINRIIEESDNIYNFRIFGLFGKYENWKYTFISGACCKALKNIPITIRQNVLFDYLYIKDFLKVVEWFIDNVPEYHVYNVTSGKKIDLISIADIINNLNEKSVPVYVCKEGLANEYTASNERLIKEFKDFQLTDINQSIKELLDYYKQNINEIDLYPLLYQLN